MTMALARLEHCLIVQGIEHFSHRMFETSRNQMSGQTDGYKKNSAWFVSLSEASYLLEHSIMCSSA
jgi:hypothetical protein